MMSNTRSEWIVTAQHSGEKLLSFLSIQLNHAYSLRALKRLIDQQCCQINGKIEKFSSALVGTGDRVVLNHIQRGIQPSLKIELSRILYEDDDFLAYNKPPGINCDDEGILKQLKEHVSTCQLVHRLDRHTTGILLVAKNSHIYTLFVEQFRKYLVSKTYLALVDGQVNQTHGCVENYLEKKKSLAGQALWGKSVTGKGLYACTTWEKVSSRPTCSLLRCYPKTGRTHQIRVHLAEIGHPILGDFHYANQFKCSYHPSRYLLHAENLRFLHPMTHSELTLSAPLSLDFKQAQTELFKTIKE